jgi:Xaa-Pro aminopeptidase
MQLIPKTIACLLAAFVSFPMISSAQEVQSLSRANGGKPVCGLGKDFHAGRRALLMELVADEIGEELIVLRGNPRVRANDPFRQDKTFWYLTGVESKDAALILDVASGREILFLPEDNAGLQRTETWDGEIWDSGDEWVKPLTGFEEVLPSKDLLKTIEELLDGRKSLCVSLHPPIGLAGAGDTAGGFYRAQEDDPLDGRLSRPKQLAMHLRNKLEVETKDVSAIIGEMRRVKMPVEQDAMRRASQSGALAMAEAIRSTRAGLGEWELEALMSWIQKRNGASGYAYAAIVGSALNACTLHYVANNKVIKDGEIILLDYGPEVDHYTTDITRSWPVNGKFTERQREIYEAVLAAQKAGIAAAKPGMTMGEINAICSKVLTERGFGKNIRHGACHWIGMAVHDSGGYGKKFVPGVTFTIEPGVYDEENGIGVRIEDVVMITEDGCEVLSAGVPREIDEIEKLVLSEGILDLVDDESK